MAIGQKASASVIRVARNKTGAQNCHSEAPLETLYAAAYLGLVEIVAKVLPRLALRDLPADRNNVIALFAITYTLHLNDIMDRHVGYVGRYWGFCLTKIVILDFPFGVTKAVVGIHVLLTRSLFGAGILHRLLLHVSLAKRTSAPVRF